MGNQGRKANDLVRLEAWQSIIVHKPVGLQEVQIQKYFRLGGRVKQQGSMDKGKRLQTSQGLYWKGTLQ